jgi:indolepyruvate ferredoxin oxidoreductase
MKLRPVTLDDKYTRTEGRVFLTGIQALVRLTLTQALRDRAEGLDTAGFVSGYRGSPLGGLDLQLARERERLTALGIHFEPGLNEELALTAVWGTQLLEVSRGARHDGVFSLWYGKAPGLDRATDALKHGNALGSAPRGGVLVVAGDDHECKSSTLPSQSELAFADAGVPVLNPAGVQEVLDYGLAGIALSRYAGCYAGLIALADTMDSSATIDADLERVRIALPSLDTSDLHFRVDRTPLALEALVFGARLDAARAFVRENALDRVVVDAPRARLGIVTTGKAHLDLMQALDDLGIDPRAADLRIYKVAMPWPLEPTGIHGFARGLDEILVVEEKRGLIEPQLKEQLYDLPGARPRVVGKRDERGRPLLAETGALSPGKIARAVASRLPTRSEAVEARLAQLIDGERALEAAAGMQGRQPFYCSGCPHNVSTQLPDDSRGLAGIGCHYMVRWMDRNTDTFSQMGGEGVQWLGQAPFTDESHVFANLGDGTYFHSGVLAIRAAVAANANITYKLLFNDAVAMTGGQSLDGQLTVPQLTRQLDAEGVGRIAVVTDEPDKYPADARFAHAATLHSRKSLAAVQRELRETPGVSVIVYDQTCAAELRRRRKRGLAPDRARRVFINESVCEGCGDCSDQSNCVSVEPVETEFGRKRRINQTSCNKDYACAEGLCPSFVSVTGGRLRRRTPESSALEAQLAGLPEPAEPALEEPWNLVITGVGGTGVVTLGALIGMAAHLDRRGSSVLDMTGLAQKGGAVISHVRIGASPETTHTSRVPTGKAHALIACDAVVAASPDAVVKLAADTTHSVLNTHLVPTAEFVMHNDTRYDRTRFLEMVHEQSRVLDTIDATRLTTDLLGDAVNANVFLLGFAYQKGLVPVSADALRRAIELNGAAVEANLTAFRWGRVAAHTPGALSRGPQERRRGARALKDVVERRVAELTEYQDAALAARYRDAVTAAFEAERRTSAGSEAFTDAVARGYFKVLAYKDEYEVARLHQDFRTRLAEEMEGDYRVELQLAPPLFSRIDPETGRPRKRTYGPWVFRVLALLARLKGLRGTPFDPFGYTRERRLERRMIAEYEATLSTLLERLSPGNLDLATRIARLPLEVRGFGAVKQAACERADASRREWLDRFLKREHAPALDRDEELAIAEEA